MKLGQGQLNGQSPAILVTGGAGFVGQRLVKLLSKEGKTVVCMYRHKLPEPCDHVFPVCTDLASPELLAAPLRGVHTVFHLAWEKSVQGNSEHDSKKNRNLISLKNLLKAMEKAKTKRLVFLSAMGSCSEAKHPFLKEKYQGESLVLNSQIPEKIIVRSTVTFSGNLQEDQFLRSIAKTMSLPGFYPLPKNRDKLATISIDDLSGILSRISTTKLSAASSILEVRGGGRQEKIDTIFKVVSESCVKGARIPIGSVFGQALLPLFEKDRSEKSSPKIQDYIELAHSEESGMNKDCSLVNSFPNKWIGIADKYKGLIV